MMIRALLRKQLRELGAAFLRSSKTGKARSRASAVGYALLFAVLVVVLMLCFAGMALPLASVLLPAGLDWLYFASYYFTFQRFLFCRVGNYDTCHCFFLCFCRINENPVC